MIRRSLIFLVLLGIALGLFYGSGLLGGFLFDDNANLLLSEDVRLSRLDAESLGVAWRSGAAGLGGRPLAQLTFALGFYASGFDPFAFKLVNLAIHWVNACLVFLLAIRAGAALGLHERDAMLAAIVGASAWAVHPLQLTSVLLVVQRMTSLSAMFVLASLLLHLAGRRRSGWKCGVCLLAAWFICWPLACLSKETALLFPGFVLVWEIFIRRNETGSFDRGAKSIALAVALLASAALFYAVSEAGAWLWKGYEFRSFTLAERLMTQGRVIWFYLGQIVFPRRDALGLYHDDIVLSRSFLDPWTTLPALFGVSLLAILAWRLRLKMPVVGFAIAWFLCGHLIESTALPLEIAHEHRNYLPSVGFAIAFGMLVSRGFSAGGRLRALTLALAGATLAVFSATTAARAYQFGDDIRRTQMEVRHHPDSARANYEAGLVLAALAERADKEAPVYTLARQHFERSMELDPAFKSGGLGIIRLDCSQGSVPSADLLRDLASRFATQPFAPGDTGFHFSLKEMAIAGALCLERPDIDALFLAGAQRRGVDLRFRARIYSWHADYLWLAGRDRYAALAALDHSLALVPGNASNRLKRAQLLYLGEVQERREGINELHRLRSERILPSEKELIDQLLRNVGG